MARTTSSTEIMYKVIEGRPKATYCALTALAAQIGVAATIETDEDTKAMYEQWTQDVLVIRAEIDNEYQCQS
jgi:hypothetical protein